MAASEMLGPRRRERWAMRDAARKVMGVGRGEVFLVGLVVVLALVLQACSVSASTANIADATMARDGAGKDPVKVFSPSDQTFYAVAEVANAPEDTTVKAIWTAVDVEDQKPNLTIDQASTEVDGGGTLTFDLTNEGPWPVGKYKVDLVLNDAEEPARTLEFEVR
jgi:hypothetical protein